MSIQHRSGHCRRQIGCIGCPVLSSPPGSFSVIGRATQGKTRLWTASEPDGLRRPQAYSRYREPCIPPVFRRSFNDK